MPSTLAQFRTRISARLIDASNAVFSTATIDEALRTALHDYSAVSPLTHETVITLPGAGRQIALAALDGLLDVSEVWWPFDSTGDEVWPPNRVRGFRVYWDDAQPVLFLDLTTGSQPQLNDELCLWYSTLHTILNLDSADSTTPRADHESLLVTGAAGYAVLSQGVNQVGSVHIDPKEVDYMLATGNAMLAQFTAALDVLRAQSARSGRPWGGESWRLDKWDRANR